MGAIYKKEMKQYLFTASGYVFAGVYMLIYALFFIGYNIINNNSDVGTMLENVIAVLTVLIPILTMRLFAEEKRMKTDMIYLSSRLHPWQIVLGKYFAAYTIFAAAVSVNLISGIIMIALGGQTTGEVAAILAGYLLTGAVFIAVGELASSMTENQIIAAVVAVLICIFLYLSELAMALTAGTWLEELSRLVSVTVHYRNFFVGIFDFRDAAYFVSFTALFIVFTVLSEESRRYGK